MDMTEILMVAVVGYFLLNALLVLVAMVTSFYLRHKAGLSFVYMPRYNEMDTKEYLEQMRQDIITPIKLFLFFVPIVVILGAYAMAGLLEVKGEEKK